MRNNIDRLICVTVKEVKELQGEGSSDLIAEALEANIFEWHFAIRGQIGSDYEVNC